MNYYISDLHFDHKNIIKFDNRPFSDVEEMNQALINNWNSVIQNNDTVYILGDFCWGKADRWVEILKQLKGQKVLIQGNHDLTKYPSELKKMFQNIVDYLEIKDGENKVILSHYPIPFYKRDYLKNVYMLYGHVHTTFEYYATVALKLMSHKCDNRELGAGKSYNHFYNVGCMLLGYTPRTLYEVVAAETDLLHTLMREAADMLDVANVC